MPKKPYSRTFRYSEETKKILDQYEGNFDMLIHYAFFKAREAEEKVFELDIECKKLSDKRDKLYNEITYLKNLHSYVYDLERHFKSLLEARNINTTF